MTTLQDAFLLCSLFHCTLSEGKHSQTGTLALECVTVQFAATSSSSSSSPAFMGDDRPDHHVYLILRIKDTEIPIEPGRNVQTHLSESGTRTYTFLPTSSDPSELVLTVALPDIPDSHYLEDIEVFEGVLGQYAVLRPPFQAAAEEVPLPTNIYDKEDMKDLRGHLVLVNQDNGEVVGEFEQKFEVKEDPMLTKSESKASDPVIIEVEESTDLAARDADALQIFARAIPPDQRDWITSSATLISHAISGSTTLVIRALSAGTSYYTNHTKPAPAPAPGASSNALAFVSSSRTRQGLAAVHSVSGQAVKVSSKTVKLIDEMIKKAMGNSKGKGRSLAPPLPSRTPSPSRNLDPPPPPYSRTPSPTTDAKPPLPPRRQPSPGLGPGPPLPARKTAADTSQMHQGKLSKKARVVLSLDLILATIDHSTRRILDEGSRNLERAVGHQYGPQAAETSVLAAGTAKNLALVYIDMRGIGRRALLRRAGKEFVKGRLHG
ncbi:unnamed protein product [Mycena citricolor]|uniref:Senescence domain-containing protein n=1 Tax=Mycena citricolor TaxID=2018698 RepID=A0AAD2HMV6_9AGAR|nr:unnamed protein product [Mycena citricolor]CAK5280987.1 unnamed protein product [Mycena citricolor]